MAQNGTPRLQEALQAAKARLNRYNGKSLGEQNTKASLIEPVLEALGWDVRDPDHVHREFKAASRDSPVDYALKIAGQPQLLVEAKGLGEDLSDRRRVAQVLGYATMCGAKWCVLTNGDEYTVYNAVVALQADKKFFFRVCLTELNPVDSSETLALIAPESVAEECIDRRWDEYVVDRDVTAALEQVLAKPELGLARLLRQSAKAYSPSEIVQSLARIQVDIAPPRVARPDPASDPSRNGPTSPRKVKEPEVTLAELVRQGVLKAPLRLSAVYKGKTIVAALLANGAVEFDGTKFASCSAAAEAALVKAGAKRASVNGWTFWSYDSKDGPMSLDQARRLSK